MPWSSLDPFDLDQELDAEELAIRDTVARFAQTRVQPHIAQWFEQGGMEQPRELARELGELGLLGMHLDTHGAAGATAAAYGVACRELEAVDSALRSLVSVQGSLAMFPIATYGQAELKDRWLPDMVAGRALGCFGLTEPDHGSNPAGMRTTARRDGTDWVLNGTKLWITNGTIADVAVIWARAEEGIRGFAVPTDSPGFGARPITHKLSMRASPTAELTLDDVRVPDLYRLDVEGLAGPLSCLAEARFGIVWGSLGAARTCLAAALEYAQTREQFGRPIGGFQLTQAKLAEMTLALGKGQLVAWRLAQLKERGTLRGEHISLGKLDAVREALEICRTARTILAANGISSEYPVLRHALNLESVLTYEGTVEMHTLVIGQAMTGIPAFK